MGQQTLATIMNTRKLMVITLVVVGAVAATGVVAATTQNSATTTTVQTDSSVDSPDPANYTRLYVDDGHQRVELKPGESDTVTASVENGESEAVELSPQLVTLPARNQPPVEQSWVSIDPADTTLDAGESREFEITVDVPNDAEIGDYRGIIGFTDETVRYPGRPPQPVHSTSVSVEVWQEPTVEINSESHIYTQLKAGGTATREISVSNTGDQAVPLSPQFNAENERRRRPSRRNTLDRSWISIDAPNEIAPGETETVEITVAPPADADRGDYRATVDLGITDPARPDDRAYWQQISLGFQLWTEPETPFETTFSVDEETTNTTLELSAHQSRSAKASQNANFDVTFVSPDGREIDAQRSRLTDSGRINLGDRRQPAQTDETYAAERSQQTFSYELSDPTAGQWSVRIMPDNTMSFEYELTRTAG